MHDKKKKKKRKNCTEKKNEQHKPHKLQVNPDSCYIKTNQRRKSKPINHNIVLPSTTKEETSRGHA